MHAAPGPVRARLPWIDPVAPLARAVAGKPFLVPEFAFGPVRFA